MQPVKLSPDYEPARTAGEVTTILLVTSNAQIAEKSLQDPDARADFKLSTDALNYHRIEWRLREELGENPSHTMAKIKSILCEKRGYEIEEFDAALTATRDRPRLPFGWTAMDLARKRLEVRPIHLLDPALEASRYAKGIVGLAVYLQEIQREESILLPVEQVRKWLAAKKVVVSGTITKLIERGLLEVTKAEYNTGSAREFKFRGVEGKDYVFLSTGRPQTPPQKPDADQ